MTFLLVGLWLNYATYQYLKSKTRKFRYFKIIMNRSFFISCYDTTVKFINILPPSPCRLIDFCKNARSGLEAYLFSRSSLPSCDEQSTSWPKWNKVMHSNVMVIVRSTFIVIKLYPYLKSIEYCHMMYQKIELSKMIILRAQSQPF